MTRQDADEINRLVGEFMDLQEAWERDEEGFDWNALQALAQRGAHAYNDDAGPSFAALAIDGMRHNALHERFLGFLLDAGFDPFRVSSNGSDGDAIPVIDHATLAEAAAFNPSSARMRSTLMELARERFAPLAEEAASGAEASASPLFATLKACAESVPNDLLQRLAPALARQDGDGEHAAGPSDGYLTAAESQAESASRPHG